MAKVLIIGGRAARSYDSMEEGAEALAYAILRGKNNRLVGIINGAADLKKFAELAALHSGADSTTHSIYCSRLNGRSEFTELVKKELNGKAKAQETN